VEVVEIDHHERKRPLIACTSFPFARKQIHHVAPIRDAGQRVYAIEPLKILLLALERRDRVGELALASSAAASLAQHLADSTDELTPTQRSSHALRGTGDEYSLNVTLVANGKDPHTMSSDTMDSRALASMDTDDCEVRLPLVDAG
jgi:hypothetical protein